MFGATLILTHCPLTEIEPEAGVTFNQEAPAETLACQLNGQLQLPVAVICTVCGPRLAPFCVALKTRELDEGCVRVQGGSTNKLTVMVCPLPLAAIPLESLPVRPIWPTYVPGVNVPVLTLTDNWPVFPAGIVPPLGEAPSHNIANWLTLVLQ